jgi:hypothetical protein
VHGRARAIAGAGAGAGASAGVGAGASAGASPRHRYRAGPALERRDVTLGATSHTNLSWNPVAWQLSEAGLEAYRSDAQAGDFWIDDVAMNTQRVGCPTK